VDDSTSAIDSVVRTAIEANRGDVKREVTVAVQGSARHGFYTWEEFRAVGGRDGLNCTPIEVRRRGERGEGEEGEGGGRAGLGRHGFYTWEEFRALGGM
jgi:hypothetical protein